MAPHRSLDKYILIAAYLRDVHLRCGAVFNYSSYRNTLSIVRRRLESEGVGFLTKTLPSLGKRLDKALTGVTPLTASDLRFKSQKGSKLPRFLGEFFSRVFNSEGLILQEPCTTCVVELRHILMMFYKYEIPYSADQEQRVVSAFKKTEDDLSAVDNYLNNLETLVVDSTSHPEWKYIPPKNVVVTRRARSLLTMLFREFDPKNIFPRHGPGAVATRQQLQEKYTWTNVSAKITQVYPFDEYFSPSMGAVCDEYDGYPSITDHDLPARVVLVPKDSRGPRLISCEPVDYQWVQQGLGTAIVRHVEMHPLTRFNVHFTDQGPNQRGALLGSSTGRYATLDLKEASDRVSLALVRLLFPPQLFEYLEACRSSATVLPNGEVLKLRKFAPMGSCLCFPIMALTIWAILTAAAPDEDTRESILVYGDDVVVPTAYAENAMEQLESFGLKLNHDKCCISGLFRESCGVDAFRGVNVTPVRLRTVWSSSPSPESYSSWLAYANAFWDKKCYHTYDYIVGLLNSLYWPIPTVDQGFPRSISLPEAPPEARPTPTKTSRRFQKKLHLVTVVRSPSVVRRLNGWSSLLRYFSEKANSANHIVGRYDTDYQERLDVWHPDQYFDADHESFDVSSYTQRRSSILERRWR